MDTGEHGDKSQCQKRQELHLHDHVLPNLVGQTKPIRCQLSRFGYSNQKANGYALESKVRRSTLMRLMLNSYAVKHNPAMRFLVIDARFLAAPLARLKAWPDFSGDRTESGCPLLLVNHRVNPILAP